MEFAVAWGVAVVAVIHPASTNPDTGRMVAIPQMSLGLVLSGPDGLDQWAGRPTSTSLPRANGLVPNGLVPTGLVGNNRVHLDRHTEPGADEPAGCFGLGH